MGFYISQNLYVLLQLLGCVKKFGEDRRFVWGYGDREFKNICKNLIENRFSVEITKVRGYGYSFIEKFFSEENSVPNFVSLTFISIPEAGCGKNPQMPIYTEYPGIICQ